MVEPTTVGGMKWMKVGVGIPTEAKVIVGGKLFADTDNWPHFNDEALKYLGTVFVPHQVESRNDEPESVTISKEFGEFLKAASEATSVAEVSGLRLPAEYTDEKYSTLLRGKPLHVFIGSTEVESWVVEGGGNCVVVDGTFPEWITLKKVEVDAQSLYFCDDQFYTTDSLDEPAWLQGDETPEGFNFVAQIPSQVDGGELINIGEGYGTAYIFADSEYKVARVLWQS